MRGGGWGEEGGYEYSAGNGVAETLELSLDLFFLLLVFLIWSAKAFAFSRSSCFFFSFGESLPAPQRAREEGSVFAVAWVLLVATEELSEEAFFFFGRGGGGGAGEDFLS